MSLRKSSSSRNGSYSDVLPKPKARRRWTPAPSRVGLDLTIFLTGRSDISHRFRLVPKDSTATLSPKWGLSKLAHTERVHETARALPTALLYTLREPCNAITSPN